MALGGADAECELPLGLTSFIFRIKPLLESNEVHGLLGVGQAAPSSCALSAAEKHACAFALEELIQTRTSELIVTNERLLGEMLERERAEKAVRESEKKYGSMLEAAHDAIFVADASTGAIIHANRKASELVGRPLEELKGLHQSDLHAEEDAEHYKAMFRERVRLGMPFTGGIQYVRHSNGRKIPVRIGTSLATSGNRVIIHGIFRDLSKNLKGG
jgi:PAS domain S-box-containing protein